MRKISNRCDLGRDFSACVDTRKKIVAIQIALFSGCGDTRKNSRDLNRDSNRAFLVCGNGPINDYCVTLTEGQNSTLRGFWGKLIEGIIASSIKVRALTARHTYSSNSRGKRLGCEVHVHNEQ